MRRVTFAGGSAARRPRRRSADRYRHRHRRDPLNSRSRHRRRRYAAPGGRRPSLSPTAHQRLGHVSSLRDVLAVLLVGHADPLFRHHHRGEPGIDGASVPAGLWRCGLTTAAPAASSRRRRSAGRSTNSLSEYGPDVSAGRRRLLANGLEAALSSRGAEAVDFAADGAVWSRCQKPPGGLEHDASVEAFNLKGQDRKRAASPRRA